MEDTEMLQVENLLKGAYDLHIHASPSPFNRLLDDFQLLREADSAKMAGILLKSHYEPTAARAFITNTYAGTTAKAYGAIALNWPVGGLNPYAVNNALKRGTKIIFMPTRDSANSLLSGDMPGDFFSRPGISIIDDNGKLKKEVLAILDVVKEYNGILATGHLSPKESYFLCKEGIKQGVRMILTHPEFSRTKINSSIQKELADQGVIIEKCWYNIAENECAIQEMVSNIRTVGAEHCYLSTDRGQTHREHPVEALGRFMAILLKNGLTEKDIYVMTHTVPRIVLQINS